MSQSKDVIVGKKITSTCCTPIGLTQMKWNIALPDHPIPPFGLSVHPLAIIIGWIDASPRNVERYNKLYRDNGFCTISLIPSSALHFLYKQMKQLALNFVNYLLDSMKESPRHIIIQVFSGNAVFLSEVYHILKNNEKYKIIIPLIRGQIYDSCPSSISEARAYKSLVATKPSLPIKMMAKFVCRTYSKVVDVEQLNKQLWERLAECPIMTPFLFYYSIDDPLTSYLDVERCIGLMKPRQIQVVTFDKSKHVNHLATHPVKYLSNLYKFWEFTLKSSNNSSSPPTSPKLSSKLQSIKSLMISKL